MANRNVFEALNATPDGGAPKNPFDLFNMDWMTSKAGQFIPVDYREVIPDGTYRMSVDNYTLTFPCNTASQADMKENYYFVFVPYYLLSRASYSFFVNRKDNHSALDYQNQQIPWFPLGDVVAKCVLECAKYQKGYRGSDIEKDVHGYIVYSGALRLLDLLGYGSYLDIVQKAVDIYGDAEGFPVPEEVTAFCEAIRTNLNNDKPNILRIAAYQKIWYCYFRNSIYDNDISPRSFNFDDVTYPQDTTYNVLDYRSLDSFISECLQLRYVQNKKDVVTASMPGTQFGAVSSVPLSTDLQGSVEIPVAGFADSSLWNINRTMIYQNNFNVAYTGIVNDGQQEVSNVVGYQSGASLLSGGAELRTSHKHPNGSVSLGTEGTNLFDVLQLTEAQAIQKWRQKSMLAGQRAKDQWRAHYGVVPAHMRDDYPDFIGSIDNVIQFSQVISTANTLAEEDKTNLGDLAGRGYGASARKYFTYHAQEYGVIMLCRSVVAENVYASFGLDRANQLIYYTDFWQPEYQNIGLEAVPKKILQSFNPSTSQVDPTGEGGNEPLPENCSVIGYAPRNYQLKHYRSRVHGLFNPNRFRDFVKQTPDFITHFGFGELEAFVQVRRDVVQQLDWTNGELVVSDIPITLSTLYCNPAITNSTFGFEADAMEDTDVFIHKVRFNCDAVQPSTSLGLPQF